MTNMPEIHNHTQQNTPSQMPSFDRRKKLSQALQQSQQPLPEHLQAHHMMSVIRHGKTLSKQEDSEAMSAINPAFAKDPPKGIHTPLHPDEYNPNTSTLYQQALAIQQQ